MKKYKCPLWNNDNDGSFDESGYEVDHIVEHCITSDDSYDNLQALCKMCHSVKTKKFLINRAENFLINRAENCREILKKDIENNAIEDNVKIIPFGEEINMDYRLDKIIAALKEYNNNPCLGLIKLLHFDNNKKENHNIYRSAAGQKSASTVLTKDGIEKSNNAIIQIINETKKFVSLIKEKYESEMKSDNRYLLEQARQIIYYDKNGYDYEIFSINYNIYINRELPLLLYNKRTIAANTMNKVII